MRPPPLLHKVSTQLLPDLPSSHSLTCANMLDGFEILTTSGVVLWSKHYVPVGVNVINSLIKDVLIEENVPSGSTAAGDGPASRNLPYKKDKYTLRWTMAKDLGLIFVVSRDHHQASPCLRLSAAGRLPVIATTFLDRQTPRQRQSAVHRALSRSIQETRYNRGGMSV